jgi:hypothetical protein
MNFIGNLGTSSLQDCDFQEITPQHPYVATTLPSSPKSQMLVRACLVGEKAQKNLHNNCHIESLDSCMEH